ICVFHGVLLSHVRREQENHHSYCRGNTKRNKFRQTCFRLTLFLCRCVVNALLNPIPNGFNLCKITSSGFGGSYIKNERSCLIDLILRLRMSKNKDAPEIVSLRVAIQHPPDEVFI